MAVLQNLENKIKMVMIISSLFGGLRGYQPGQHLHSQRHGE